jgi:hypothetical protein
LNDIFGRGSVHDAQVNVREQPSFETIDEILPSLCFTQSDTVNQMLLDIG